jgi:PAS domain S-box-containing protein
MNSPSFENATACFNESVFFPQKIQAWGYLVVIDIERFTVRHLSENWEALTGKQAELFLDKPLSDLIGAENVLRLEEVLKKGTPSFYYSSEVTLHGSPGFDSFEARFFWEKSQCILEWVPKAIFSSPLSPDSSLCLLKEFKELFNVFPEKNSLSEASLKFIRQMTGFDRVLLYVFKEDASGKVVAEAKKSELGSMLNLHYPSEDIPLEIRNLFKIQKTRIIADFQRAPSPVFSSPAEASIDMTYCKLRYPPESHLIYLKNMGIQTSVSVAILRDSELWGLLILHHYTPRFLSQETLSLLEMMGELLSENLRILSLKEKVEYQKRTDKLTHSLLQKIYENPDIESLFLTYKDEIQQIFDTNHVFLLYKNHVYSSGAEVPSHSFFQALSQWLAQKQKKDFYYTRCLPSEFPPAAPYASICCGIAAICLSDNYEDWLIWAKPESIDTLTWAGSPYISRASLIQAQAQGIKEGKLFERWIEHRTGFSQSWGELTDYYLEKLASIKHIIQRKELEKIYQSIIEGSLDAIGLYQQDLRCLFISPKITEILGYAPSEFISLDWAEKIHPEDFEPLQFFVTSGEIRRYSRRRQVRFLNASGEYVWLDIAFSPIRQAQFSVPQYTVIFRDITLQKEAEFHNQKLYNELSAQQNAISQLAGLIIFKANLEIVSANDYIKDILGVSTSEQIDLKPILLEAAYPMASTIQELWDTILSGYSWSGELCFEKREKRIWLLASVYPYTEGEQRYFLLLCFDITQKKEYEAEFLKAKLQLEELVTYSPAVIYSAIAGDSFYFTFMSANVEALLGYPKERFIANPEFILQIIHPDDLLLIQKNNSRLVQTEHFSLEYRIQNQANQWVWVYDSKRIYRTTEQARPEIYGSWIDITQRKEFEYELQRANQSLAASEMTLRLSAEEQQTLNRELEEKNILLQNLIHLERSHNEQLNQILVELKNTQKQLIHSEKMASLGTLTAGLAHEINNPINFIQGSVDILNRISPKIIQLLQWFDSKKQELLLTEKNDCLPLAKENYSKILALYEKSLNNIALGIQRTNEIIFSLKSFSRTEGVQISKVNIYEVLDSTIVLLRNKFKNRITIHKDYEQELPSLESFPGQLNQVFLNIIDNAIQAIPETGHIYITVRNYGKAIAVKIRDTGKGMAPEIQNHIFDPFFSTKPAGEGTGLGLAISYSIIQNLGGSISFKSELNLGTEFEVILPIHYKAPANQFNNEGVII